MKKYLSLFMGFLLTLNLFVFHTVSAEDTGLTKRVLLNVAQNKIITSNQASTYSPSNLVDGNKNTFVVPTGGDSTKTEFIIDLERRYKIERIELYSRFDGGLDYLGRQYFEFIGANKDDFSDAVRLDYMEEQNDEIFPPSGCFTSSLDGKAAYRYIKLKRTGGGYYGYSEICVYAYQSVTEVSRGKAVVTSPGSAISGDKAVNGTNNDSMDAWVNDKINEYNYLSVDLGKPLPVGMIEIEGRNITSENPATRQDIAVYGSNSSDNLSALASSAKLTEDDGYSELLNIGVFTKYLSNEFPYGKYPLFFRSSVSEKQSFQHITFRNTTLHCSAYGEVRVYVVNPEILSVTWDSDYLYINFSDEMNENAGDYISLANANGSFKDSYTYALDIKDLKKDESYELLISKNAESKKGVMLAEDYLLRIKSLNTLNAEKISFFDETDNKSDDLYGLSEIKAKTSVYNNGKTEKTAALYLSVYDTEGRMKLIDESKLVVPSGEKRDFETSLAIKDILDDGIYAKAFIWDMTENLISPIGETEKLLCDGSNIYVSTKGNDDGKGTKNAPFATLERAKQEVSERNDDMTKDISVHIEGGTYLLNETLAFNENDSGKNGYFVNYTAEEGEEVLVSGGTKITGWESFDAERNIYKADISGISDIRNLYVNGRSARTARSEERIKPLRLYTEDDVVRGFYVSADSVGLYENASDIRLFYTQVWKYTYLPVESITQGETDGENIIKMQSKAFSIAVDEDTYLPVTTENAFYVENAKELLDKPGEFYFDKTTETEGIIYYMADENEDMERAEVYVPTLDRLIHIEGSDLGNKVENIRFKGIHFAHSSRSDIYDGYLGGQAQGVTPLETKNTSYPLDNTIVGANIRVIRAENIVFENNTFSGLTSVALGIYEGSNDITVRGNAFYDIGDSAVTVGLPSDAYMEDAYYDEDGNYLGRNVALYKPAKGANGIGAAPSGNDGDAKTVWTTNYITNYWQVDLGKEYEISQIRVKSRLDYGSNPDVYEGTELYRKNFKVLGSNDENFTDGGTLLAQQGNTAFDFKTGFIGNVEAEGKFRFIRVVKTANEHFPLADIEVISPDQTIPLKEVSKRTVIDNNYITRIGEFNLGAPGIQLYYTEDAVISHNVIKDVPYSGICVGWGWLNTTDSTTAKNNKVLNNHIENYAMRTYDAGGVYLLGAQTGNLVEGNHMINQPNAYWPFYPDSGSENFVVKNNVFEDVDMTLSIGYVYQPTTKKNMIIIDNYSTTPACVVNYSDANSTVEEPNVYIKTNIPVEAQAIIDAAGLEAEYNHVALNIPEGRWHLTAEDIYGDVIDHQKSYEGGSVSESMPDTTLISYYLTNRLIEARSILSLGRDSASADAVSAFEAAINKATAEETQFKNLGYGYNNTTKAPIDRAHLIDVRVELIDAIDSFVESIK